MASVLIARLIDGSQTVEDDNGIRVVDPYHVSGIDPTRHVGLQALIAAGLPRYGVNHSDSPYLVVRNREVRPWLKSKTEARVLVTYQPPSVLAAAGDDVVVEFHATATEELTNFDVTGKPIKVDYKAKDGTKLPTMIGQVRGPKLEGVLTADFTTYQNPSIYDGILGKMNSRAWRGGGKYTWLVFDVDIRKVKSRQGWQVHLGIHYDPQTHIRTAVYRDPHGFVPKDIDPVDKSKVSGNGWTNVKNYYTTDLNKLRIPQAY